MYLRSFFNIFHFTSFDVRKGTSERTSESDRKKENFRNRNYVFRHIKKLQLNGYELQLVIEFRFSTFQTLKIFQVNFAIYHGIIVIL